MRRCAAILALASAACSSPAAMDGGADALTPGARDVTSAADAMASDAAGDVTPAEDHAAPVDVADASPCGAGSMLCRGTYCGDRCLVNVRGCDGSEDAGACQIGCVVGYADCNGMWQDGCETDLMTNRSNCSRCGYVCPGGASAVCANGLCQ